MAASGIHAAVCSVPVLQREGRLKYALTGGQYRAYNSSVEKTPFGRSPRFMGFRRASRSMAGAGCQQISSRLRSEPVKTWGISARFPSMSRAAVNASQYCKNAGQSRRARYSKNVINTGTNFSIAGYRYSTRGYYGLGDVLDSGGNSGALQDERRNRLELTMSQTLGGDRGALTLSAAREDYWNADRPMASWVSATTMTGTTSAMA